MAHIAQLELRMLAYRGGMMQFQPGGPPAAPELQPLVPPAPAEAPAQDASFCSRVSDGITTVTNGFWYGPPDDPVSVDERIFKTTTICCCCCACCTGVLFGVNPQGLALCSGYGTLAGSGVACLLSTARRIPSCYGEAADAMTSCASRLTSCVENCLGRAPAEDH